MIEIIDTLCQMIVVCTGCTSLYFLAGQQPQERLKGALVGLSGEPFWFFTAAINSQWGIMILCFVYGVSWGRIAYSNYKVIKALNILENIDVRG